MKTIGILGGMGPAASAQTYAEVVRVCQRSYDACEDEAFPTIIVYSLPLAGFDYQGFDIHQASLVREQLIDALQKMVAAGAELCLVDCNTVHVFYDQMQASVDVPIISLIDTTVSYVEEKNFLRVGVLSSETSRRLCLYEHPLETIGVSVLPVTNDEQRIIDGAIYAVMGGVQNFQHVDALNEITDRMFAEGADSVIFGCTEISLLLHDRIDAHHYIDSQWLAIQKIVMMSYQSLP